MQLHLSIPTTKRGYRCPIIASENNTHLIYITNKTLVFRGLDGAPNAIYWDHRQKITCVVHRSGSDYAFGDEQGNIVHFKFNAENGTINIGE